MIWLKLYYAFFITGLFTIGGGLAAIPFLFAMVDKYRWFSTLELTNMIAISQSTPGAIGINMATYAGLNVAGFSGGVLATVALVSPAFILLFVLLPILEKYKDSVVIKSIFYALRPVSAGLVSASGLVVLMMCLIKEGHHVFDRIQFINFFVFIALTVTVLKVKNFTPIMLIIMGAIVGVLLKL